MFSNFLRPWIFALALSALVSAEDTVSSGSYLITLCNAGHPNSRASKLQSLLPQVWNGLQNVIADLQLGSASSHGYSTFFKNDSSKEEVLQVYKKIAAGASVARGRRPTFMCVDDVPETDFLYRYCMRESGSPLMMWRKTQLIPLCPVFWTIKKQALLPDCPLVVANTLTPNDSRLLDNQGALLVSVLVHFYHEVHRTLMTNITDVSELTASESLLNAPTYGLYYAGGFLIRPQLRGTKPANIFYPLKPCRLAAPPSRQCVNHTTNFVGYKRYPSTLATKTLDFEAISKFLRPW